jgi:hypothetical protein
VSERQEAATADISPQPTVFQLVYKPSNITKHLRCGEHHGWS